MSTMDHAAAHERIEDLLLEPARLRLLDSSTEPDDLALLDHVAACAACRADLEGWERLEQHLAAALPPSAERAREAVEPVELPPSLRAQVIGAVRDAARDAGAAPARPRGLPAIGAADSTPTRSSARSRSRLGAWAALAASIAVIAGATGITLDQLAQRAAAQADARGLAAALAVVDRMLATDHVVVELQTTAGAPAGTISWSRHDWVVLTSALEPPAAGREYLCWLETDGSSVPVGHMEFAGGTAYWVASIDEWQTWEIGPTTRFVVSLEAVGAPTRTGPVILEAPLGS
jgi:hypothetical protein